MRIEYELFDVLRQTKVTPGVSGPASEARMLAHRVADAVYEKLTGIRGAFATRLLYVSVTRVPGGKDYFRLTLADSDGARPIVLLESRSRCWRPPGRRMASRLPMYPLRPVGRPFTARTWPPARASS